MNTQKLLHELEKHLANTESYAKNLYISLSAGKPGAQSAYATWRNAQAASKVAAELRAQMEGAETVRKESEV